MCIIQLKPPKGGSTAASLFILGACVAAFVGRGSPLWRSFREGVHTAGSRRNLGGILEVFGRISAGSRQILVNFLPKRWPRGAPEAPKNDKKMKLCFQNFFGIEKRGTVLKSSRLLALFWGRFWSKKSQKNQSKNRLDF